MDSIDLNVTYLTNEAAPHCHNGSDYDTRYRLLWIGGRETFVSDERGEWVMRAGKPVRV